MSVKGLWWHDKKGDSLTFKAPTMIQNGQRYILCEYDGFVCYESDAGRNLVAQEDYIIADLPAGILYYDYSTETTKIA